MLVVNKILIARDFSDASARVLRHGLALAAKMQAQLHVLHVTNRTDSPYSARDLPAVRDELRAAGVASEEALMAVPIIGVSQKDGGVADTIHRYAQAEDIDLIALGTHGRAGAGRLWRGSVAESVIRRAKRPVLTVRGDGNGQTVGPGQVERILVPIDVAEYVPETGKVAVEWARLYDAQVDLLHVVTGASPPPVPDETDDAGEPEEGPEQRARRALMDIGRTVSALGVPMEVHVRTGTPGPTITNFMEARGTHLVVMSTHGRTGMERFFLGSVAEAVIRHGGCPVLTVRASGRSIRALNT
jgi:nucleotide-binding universal stress UspA family protein